MINLSNMLTEDRSNLTARKGCLMAMLSKNDSNLIVEFGKKLIKDENLYVENNEYGRETEGHITIRYGFIEDLNELQIRQLLKGQKSFVVELIGLNKFDSDPKYDVAVFKANSPVLKKLHELSGVHLNETNYPNYDAHLTLAYVKKGTFHHIKEELKLKIPIKEICYSPIFGGKSYFNLEEISSSNNNNIDIDFKIQRLEQEWERLDPLGIGRSRQIEIEKELANLQYQKNKRFSKPTDPKYRNFWAKLHQNISQD